MPADIMTAVESGSAAGAQTSAAQNAIGALQNTTQQGVGSINNNLASANSALANTTQNADQWGTDAFNQTVGYLAPYSSFGQAGGNQLMNLLGLGAQGSSGMMTALQSTPGYQFSLQQGLQAVQNGATANGLGVSGAAQKAAANYATGLAGQTYQNQVGNALQATGIGLNAAQGMSSAGTNYGNMLTGNQLALGQGMASNYMNAGSQDASLYSNLGQNVGNQYTNIGQAKANADMATAQAMQNTESELISAAGSAAGAGKFG